MNNAESTAIDSRHRCGTGHDIRAGEDTLEERCQPKEGRAQAAILGNFLAGFTREFSQGANETRST